MPRRRKRKLKIGNLIIVIVSLLVVCVGGFSLIHILTNKKDKGITRKDPSSVSTNEPVETEEPKENKISLFLTGDGLLHDSVYTDAENEDGTFDFGKQLDEVLNVVGNYDLAYYNQETLLGGTELGLSGYPTFNSPKEFGSYMVSKGFNLISTANNHCLDKGFRGVQSSREFWNSQPNVLMSGTNSTEDEYNAIPAMEVNGIKIAFLAYCEHTNGINPDYSWEVNYYPGHEEEMLEKVRQAKSENDVVIVSMHWGTEYSHEVNSTQTTLADQLTSAGADIVVGNHPHVIQPFQWVNNKPVFYAMGNLISTQLNQENLVGLCAGLDITKKEDGSIVIDNVKADLMYTTMEGTYPALRYNVQVHPMKNVSDETLQAQQCNKDYTTVNELYEASKAIVTSLDSNITIGGIFE